MAQFLIGTASVATTTYQVWAEQTATGINFTIKLAQAITGTEDILGFFFDYADSNPSSNPSLVGPAPIVTANFFGNGGDGQNPTPVGDDRNQIGHANNTMQGTGFVFDAGMQFGVQGGNEINDVTGVSFTVAGLTFADLDGMRFGIRAQGTAANT